MARPRKNIEDQKLIQVNIRFSVLDYEKLHELSAISGLSIAAFIRKSSLNKRIPKALIHPVNRELLVLLSRYYDSINELIEEKNEALHDESILVKEIQAVLRLLHEMKLNLIANDSKTS